MYLYLVYNSYSPYYTGNGVHTLGIVDDNILLGLNLGTSQLLFLLQAQCSSEYSVAIEYSRNISSGEEDEN